MIKRNVFKQTVPETTWVVSPLESNATMGRALAAYDAAGNSISWDSWEFKEGKLHVNFGIDPVTGSLSYEYQLEDSPVIKESPLVSINTNYGNIQVSNDPIMV